MTALLSDHDIEGHAQKLLDTLRTDGWLALYDIQLIFFRDIGLAENSSDRDIWRTAQENQMLLLTGNRNMDDDDSLEKTLRDENVSDSLPVLTIGKVENLEFRDYRSRCAVRIVEIVEDLNNYRGTGRLFIP